MDLSKVLGNYITNHLLVNFLLSTLIFEQSQARIVGFDDDYMDDSGFDQTMKLNNMLGLPYAYTPQMLNELFITEESLLAKTRRRRHPGIVEECCRKACTFTEMSFYCNNP